MQNTLVEVDPLRALWRAVGSPCPALRWGSDSDRCARCGDTNPPTVRVVDVVSDKFTGWDAYTHAPGIASWCVACAWGHTDKTLRQLPWVVTSAGTAEQATPTRLGEVLARALPEHTAVIIPVSRKKHLLPDARWGHVTTDQRPLPWGSREATRLGLVRDLREAGFSEAALGEPVPRFEHLRTLDPDAQRAVLATWADLAPWRADPAYLAVACRATRKDRA